MFCHGEGLGLGEGQKLHYLIYEQPLTCSRIPYRISKSMLSVQIGRTCIAKLYQFYLQKLLNISNIGLTFDFFTYFCFSFALIYFDRHLKSCDQNLLWNVLFTFRRINMGMVCTQQRMSRLSDKYRYLWLRWRHLLINATAHPFVRFMGLTPENLTNKCPSDIMIW